MASSKSRHKAASVTLDLLRAYESRNVTFIEPDGSWPIVWERARGVDVWDATGKRYLDLTAAFGVAAAGHANPSVVRAGQGQMAKLLHAMGDVHPHALKARLVRELSRLTFERWSKMVPARFAGRAKAHSGKTILCNSGFEAVEAALKTVFLATRKPGVIAFEGAYHGLGYGALNATHREHFRSSFREQLGEFGFFVPFPAGPPVGQSLPTFRRPARGSLLADVAGRIQELFRRRRIGAILVEAVQVRGGVNVPDGQFLKTIRELCDRNGALLILDEIYTGFGRTGKWFACEHSGVIPDLICLGKALTGGFPLSACVGRADLMDAAWPPSEGEAIHTSTFLGHPVGCAMALAQIKEIEDRGLVARSAKLGRHLLSAISSFADASLPLRVNTRGLGLLAGVELLTPDGRPATAEALTLVKRLLHKGYLFLPEGEFSNVISFTPPLTIPQRRLDAAVSALGRELRHL